MRKVCLIGAGSYGTAVARVVANNLSRLDGGFDPTLYFWARRASLAQEMQVKGENAQYLAGAALPGNMDISSDLAHVLSGCQVVIVAIPSNHLSLQIMQLIADHAGESDGVVHLVSLVKGIEFNDGKLKLISDLLREGVKHTQKTFEISVLMGANVADQMGRDEFAEATLGCGATSALDARALLSVFDDPDRFAVTSTMDRSGVELSGALKNVVALAAGYSEGLDLGSNTKAAIIRRGFGEIIRFAKMFFLDVEDATFFESSGIADLMTTCFAGRGQRLAAEFVRCRQKKDWATLEKELLNGQQIPDWHNVQHVYHFLRSRRMLEKFPLFTAVYMIGFAHHPPIKIVDALKARPSGAEGADANASKTEKKRSHKKEEEEEEEGNACNVKPKSKKKKTGRINNPRRIYALK